MGLNIPLIDVNHMQAHILAHFIDEEGFNKPPFPFLAMTISGGHTQIVKVSGHFEMEVIGENNVRSTVEEIPLEPLPEPKETNEKTTKENTIVVVEQPPKI